MSISSRQALGGDSPSSSPPPPAPGTTAISAAQQRAQGVLPFYQGRVYLLQLGGCCTAAGLTGEGS